MDSVPFIKGVVNRHKTTLQNKKMTLQKHIEITKKDFVKILGDDWQEFEEKIIPNCFCGHCWDGEQTVSIVDYKIFLNNLGDVILRGFCAECGKRVNRYVETGEVARYASRIKQLREKVGFEL